MKKLIICFFILIYSISISQVKSKDNLIQYVNPFIGTQKMGHTYPGATVPFGAVQLSPETDTVGYEKDGKYNPEVYKYCAGYQYDDNTIVGFTHTHFSGTGHSDLGDILIMPTIGIVQLNPGTKTEVYDGYRSTFSHSLEYAEPNYYKVKLSRYNINAELTTTLRTGFHQYTFPKTDSAHIILDLEYGIYNYEDKNVWTYIRVENDTLITGYRQTNGWARTRTVYFAMIFSKPFNSFGSEDFNKKMIYRGFWRKFNQRENFPEVAGKQIKLYFNFNTIENEKIKIKVALSSVSTKNALQNLLEEIPHWDFEKVKKNGQDEWNKEFSKIRIETITEEDKINFYTSLYHTMLSPTIYYDINGEYRGLDQNIYKIHRNKNYSTFSLWDTYRALHPLFNLIQQKRNRDICYSMLQHYNQSVHKILPIWSHYSNDNWCMIGYHSVSVISDAIIKGILKTDLEEFLTACINSSNKKYYDGIEYYLKYGYVPEDKNSSSVSKTLEYAYDDWCISQIAKKLNNNKIYNDYFLRAENWKNVYDSTIGFMRPKLSDGKFKENFDVLSTHNQGFIEGNAWNYSLYVPHQPEEMIKVFGGKKRFTNYLDSLFSMYLPDKYFAETEDITRDGIIGNYVHGNEPSHHIPYLYNWTDEPEKTCEKIRLILKNQYKAKPDGLGGNDDCGQMSAWYIFSSLGFYPVAPGSDKYWFGSPIIKSARMNLENGKTFIIEAKNQSEKNIYVAKIILNGKELKRNYITHSEIMNGGKLVFEMSESFHNKLTE